MNVLLSSTSTWVALSLAAATAQEAGALDAVGVLERMHAELGPGASAGAPLRFEGTATWKGLPGGGTCTEVYAGLRHARNQTEFEGFGLFEVGCDGEVVWEKNSLEIQSREGWHGAEYLRRFGVAQNAHWREMYASAGAAERVELEGRAFYRLELVPLPLVPCDVELAPPPADVWYVDAETWLPARIDSRALGLEGDVVEIRHRLSDWRDAAGGKFAFHRELEVSGFTLFTDYASVERGVELAPDFFDLPEDVVNALAGDGAARAEDAPVGDGDVELVKLEPRHLASIRVQCKRDEMQKHLSAILPEAMQHVMRHGATMSGPPIVRYHSFGDELDIEGAMQVAEPVEPEGRVVAETLPGGQAAVAWHVGAYDTLSETHDKLQAFLADNGLEARGAAWEEYWTDPGMEPDPGKWRTKVVIPVAEKGPAARVELVTLESRPFASIRTRCKAAEMQRTLAVVLPEVMRFVLGSGAQAAGPPAVRYHEFGEEIDLEGGVPLVEPVEGQDRVEAQTLPGGLAAVIWHVGPYHDLPATHEELQAWLAAEGYRQRAPLWEEYWTDPGMEPDASKWRTKIVMPVAKLAR